MVNFMVMWWENIDIKNKRYDDEYANVCLTYSYLNHDYTIEEN